MNNELTVTRSNALVESSYYLKLNERRLVEIAIAKIKSGERIPSEIKITAKEYSDTWGVSMDNAFRELRQAERSLYEREIKLKKLDNGEVWSIRWLSAKGYQEGEGYTKICFT